ncbi:MAG TPA: hypothetical protein VGP33_06635 [Chloroflexota bacterium]|jgi:hypothetical protein|nr:hypothetical protein [Chloroflexota bacterium]
MTTPVAPLGAGEAAVIQSAVLDLAKRAGHTFWQAAAANLTVLYAASGLHVHELLSISGAEKALVTVVGGAAAAGFSAVKTLVASYLSSKKALS